VNQEQASYDEQQLFNRLTLMSLDSEMLRGIVRSDLINKFGKVKAQKMRGNGSIGNSGSTM